MKVWASSALILLPLISVALLSCQYANDPGIEDKQLQGLVKLLETEVTVLDAPEAMECRDTLEVGSFPEWSLLGKELAQLRKYSRQVEPILLENLRNGHHGAAYVLAYLGTTEALPILRERLLNERYFYGWEGTDRTDEKSYLSDNQFPRHVAYMTAIERISGQPIWEAMKLSDAEKTKLENEARKIRPLSTGTERYFAAKWLLIKLTHPPEWED